MPMTHEEAARILDPETSAKALSEYGDGSAQIAACDEACRIAADVLRNKPTGEALTLEQLLEMDGQPVYCGDRKEWGIIHVDPDGPWANAPFFRGVYCDLDVQRNGLSLYDYPPANIDREAEEIKKAMIDINNLAVSYIENGPYENDLPGMEFAVKVDRISKAWAELEKRMGLA